MSTTSDAMSIDESVSTAINETVEPEVSDEANDSEETETVETQEEDLEDTEETEDDVEEITQEELQLLRDLKDPAKKQEVIRNLAKAEKILEERIDKGEAPKTQKQIEKTAKEIAQELLGDEFTLLPDKFIDLLELLISRQVNPIKQESLKVQTQVLETQIDESFNKLNTKHEGDLSKYADRMTELSHEVAPKADESVEAYILRIYKYAKAEAGDKVSPSTTSRKDSVRIRVQRNANDPTFRTASPDKLVKPSKALTLDESIALAEKSIRKK